MNQEQKPQSRRNLGRNARRRRKKVLAIEAAASEAASGTPSSALDKSALILPQDRGYIWPAVRDLCQLSENDKHALLGQLGYLPGNALRVICRVKDFFPNGDDDPLAIQLYPLVLREESDSTRSHRKRSRRQEDESNAVNNSDNENQISNILMEPFPTMYWVTHPRFRALISKLELTQEKTNTGACGGKISHFQERLQQEVDALESMKAAHENYGKVRHDLITKDDWEWIKKRKWEKAFSVTRGVAGIRNYGGIKCLHAHAAHYWSGCVDNVVGKWVSDEIQLLLKEKLSS